MIFARQIKSVKSGDGKFDIANCRFDDHALKMIPRSILQVANLVLRF